MRSWLASQPSLDKLKAGFFFDRHYLACWAWDMDQWEAPTCLGCVPGWVWLRQPANPPPPAWLRRPKVFDRSAIAERRGAFWEVDRIGKSLFSTSQGLAPGAGGQTSLLPRQARSSAA